MMSDLTEDLVEEILARVPARSLKRLRSTCKRWNALFHDNRFTKKHFERSEKEFLILMWKARIVYSVGGQINNNVDPYIELKGQLDLPSYRAVRAYEIIHCNGLLLWSTCVTLTLRVTLVVYNPCTRQTRWITPVRKAEYHGHHIIALGYKTNQACYCESYKILRFGYTHKNHRIIELEIYEFKSNSWRVLDDIISDWNLELEYRSESFKGDTYWIAYDGENVADNFLLRFDFTEERFQRLYLPFEWDWNIDNVALSTVRQSLAVLIERTATIGESKLELWLTDQPHVLSWSMLFKVDLNWTYKRLHSMSFVVDEEKILAVWHERIRESCYETKTYILGEDAFRQVDFRGVEAFEKKYCCPFLFSYVPSLIQI